MSSEKHKSREAKKHKSSKEEKKHKSSTKECNPPTKETSHKSSKGEKKRKRDHTEDGAKKSKKHRSEKSHAEADHEEPTPSSPFHTQTATLYLPLAPISQKHPLEGLCAEHLSPLILTYYPPFAGVILSYSNPRLSERAFGDDGHETLLDNRNEYAVSWTWVTADFLLFKAEKGTVLEGYVNLQNQGHLGVVCWNLFNASVEAKRLPKDWTWRDFSEVDDENEDGNEGYAENGIGCWVDGELNKVEGVIKFKVKEIESSHDKERGFLSIEGTLLGVDDENSLLEKENQEKTTGRENAGRRLGGDKALGATSLGVEPEQDLLGGSSGGKHRTKY